MVFEACIRRLEARNRPCEVLRRRFPSSQSCSAVLTGSCLFALSICLNNRRRLHNGGTSDAGFSTEEATVHQLRLAFKRN
ncbi:hypothetical protein PIB30_112329, partial [Stylosanthes scabra]|nr:hypothetical protein [Stylosanthes scabra]